MINTKSLRAKFDKHKKITKNRLLCIGKYLLNEIDHYQSEEIQKRITGYDDIRAIADNRLAEIKVLLEEKSAAHKAVGTRPKIIDEQNAVIEGMSATIVAQATFISMKNLVGSKTWQEATKTMETKSDGDTLHIKWNG